MCGVKDVDYSMCLQGRYVRRQATLVLSYQVALAYRDTLLIYNRRSILDNIHNMRMGEIEEDE